MAGCYLFNTLLGWGDRGIGTNVFRGSMAVRPYTVWVYPPFLSAITVQDQAVVPPKPTKKPPAGAHWQQDHFFFFGLPGLFLRPPRKACGVTRFSWTFSTCSTPTPNLLAAPSNPFSWI